MRIYNKVLHKMQDTVSYSIAKYRGVQKVMVNVIKYYGRRKKNCFDQ